MPSSLEAACRRGLWLRRVVLTHSFTADSTLDLGILTVRRRLARTPLLPGPLEGLSKGGRCPERPSRVSLGSFRGRQRSERAGRHVVYARFFECCACQLGTDQWFAAQTNGGSACCEAAVRLGAPDRCHAVDMTRSGREGTPRSRGDTRRGRPRSPLNAERSEGRI